MSNTQPDFLTQKIYEKIKLSLYLLLLEKDRKFHQYSFHRLYQKYFVIF